MVIYRNRTLSTDQPEPPPYGYWVDRGGNLIPVTDAGGHETVARELFPNDYETILSKKGFIRVVMEEIRKTVYFESDCTLENSTVSQIRTLKNLATNFEWKLVDDTTEREIDPNEPFAAIIASLKEGQSALAEFPANTWKDRFGPGLGVELSFPKRRSRGFGHF